ncbi:MAG: sugar ABC transporter ATP-binding protein [Christensenellaceae bacterium]|nr:sugar ABC transporter ATP-binding protein [Christensenellaceae bacterium]
MSETLLKFNNISKLFPGVVALDDVSMEFKKGEVHALCGENGAGKSTLIKILTGAYTPTSGTIEYDGKVYTSMNTKEAIAIGISAIYQEFNLVPYLSVAQNVFFGNEATNGLFLNKREMNKRTAELAAEMGIEVDPTARIKDLGVAYSQITEIIKSISRDAKIIVMDEPSAPLTNREIDAMFNVIRKLKEKGITIIYISHRLEEIFEICDRVSVMRDGKYISTKNVCDVTQQELIADMVGRELGDTFVGGAGASDEVVLEVKGLTTNKIKDISFTLKKGEILGLGGLVGAGRTETARAIFGADRLVSGEIYVKGEKVDVTSPKKAIESGIGFLTEDRKGQGLLLGRSVKENTTYTILKQLTKGLFIDEKENRRIAEEKREELRTKTPHIDQLVKFLSGGNQQKVVLAKWLVSNSDILIFDEPTRGIDVGAKQEIYEIMHKLTEEGKSIIMISSEMPELLGMSDRVLVMYEGRLNGEFMREEFSQEAVLTAASGM